MCTRLRTPVDKEGKHDVCVDMEAFKKGKSLRWGFAWLDSVSSVFIAGWAIPRKDITLGQLLGKGEFGGGL